MGRELFLAASYLNHSCEPNCIIRRRGAFGFISTLRAVEVLPYLLTFIIEVSQLETWEEMLLVKLRRILDAR